MVRMYVEGKGGSDGVGGIGMSGDGVRGVGVSAQYAGLRQDRPNQELADWNIPNAAREFRQ